MLGPQNTKTFVPGLCGLGLPVKNVHLKWLTMNLHHAYIDDVEALSSTLRDLYLLL